MGSTYWRNVGVWGPEGSRRCSFSSGNVYSATLTAKREDDDPSTERFFFASTLLIQEPVNQTTLTCTGGGGEDPVDKSTTITQGGEIDDSFCALTNTYLSSIVTAVNWDWTEHSNIPRVGPSCHYV